MSKNSGKSKRKYDDSEEDPSPDSNKKSKTATKEGFFSGLSFYILRAGIEKARMNIFKNQIIQNGGRVEESTYPTPTPTSASATATTNDNHNQVSHILVDDKMDVDRMLRLLGIATFPDVIVVKTMWLSVCLKKKEFVNTQDYELRPRKNTSHIETDLVNDSVSDATKTSFDKPSGPQEDTKQIISHQRKTHTSHEHNMNYDDNYNGDSDYAASDEDEPKLDVMDSQFGISRKNIPVNSWICAQSSKNPQPNHNKHITDKLEEMVKAYASTNDKWRSYGYQKCIRALMRHPKTISSWEEAKALPAVGGRLADKIWEIAQSGELRKLNEFKSSEEIRTLELFNNVWGAGPHTSNVWYQQGFRTIEDIRTKAKLTSQQKVGVRLYDDLVERMSREEAGRIADVVKEAAEGIQPGIIAQACGSYRRGKVTCGDVDVLVTHPDGRSHKGIFGKLLEKLHEIGFLTDDLVSSEDNGNQKKYLGVCKLLGDDTKHRRLDIIVVPYHEYACAVVYFTGSAHFNRSLRLLCKRQDMSLSEHALRAGVIRQGGERVHEGTIIPTPTEESVFKILKVPYRPPEERDH